MAVRGGLAEVLPEYKVLHELGRGAMGVVLLGRHRSLDRLVAIKELPPKLAGSDAIRGRFSAEARAVASLNHPHVVVVHDFVDREGHLALIMEELPGGTVWDRFTHSGVTPSQACAMVLAASAGLHHAHTRGLVHRDIKPENLMFDGSGQLKVTDFGIAAVVSGDTTVTTSGGDVVGTPAYMSPEQARGETVGPPTDVYACATVLFELLSGRLPFEADDASTMLSLRRTQPAPGLRDVAPHVPLGIASVVDRALAVEPTDRPASAEAFGVALGEAAADAWGPDWLDQAGTPVRASDAIERAARTSSLATSTPPKEPAFSASVDTAASSPDQAVLPARSTPHPRGANLAQVDPDEFVKISKARTDGSPLLPFLLAAATACACVAVGFGLIGGTEPTSDAVRAVVVNGSTEMTAQLDLTESFTVSNIGTNGPVEIGVFLSEVPLGSVESQAAQGVAVVDPDWLRWTSTGLNELRVSTTDGKPLGAAVVDVTAPEWFMTVPPAALGLLALLAASFASSHRRNLRSGRVRLLSFVGIAVGGAALGACTVAAAAISSQQVAEVSTASLCAALGAGAALFLGEATRRRGRRRRRAR